LRRRFDGAQLLDLRRSGQLAEGVADEHAARRGTAAGTLGRIVDLVGYGTSATTVGFPPWNAKLARTRLCG
jgi:hypothetical protein